MLLPGHILPRLPTNMRVRTFRRTTIFRIIQASTLLLLFWSAVDTFYAQILLTWHSANEPEQLGNEKIYIASIHWNNEAILRSHWVSAVIDLAKEMGQDNVFVSIQESGSWDDSKGALKILDMELEKAGIRREIILDPTTHEDEIGKPPAESGWIWTPREKMELRRIPYLARLRNLVLEPLHTMRESGEVFDKILFLNDVVFTSRDIRRLISTRNGDYAAACALDFSKPPQFYDTFALRDSEGHAALMQTWPFFRARRSRRALKANRAVPLSSCWNGIGTRFSMFSVYTSAIILAFAHDMKPRFF